MNILRRNALQKFKSVIQSFHFRDRLDFFLDYGYLHGIRFLGRRCGTLGKIFWAIVLLLSAVPMSYIFKRTLDSFQQDVVTTSVDMSYLHWTNTFPAVSICFEKGDSQQVFTDFGKEHLTAQGVKIKMSTLGAFVKALQTCFFLTSNSYFKTAKECKGLNASCGVDIDKLRRQLLPQSCSEFLFNVTYLGRPVNDCEELFKLRITEMGYCYIANSLYSHDFDYEKLPMTYDRSNPYRALTFGYDVNENYKLEVYIHSPDSDPYFNMEPFKMRKSGVSEHLMFQTIEIQNDADVKLLPVEARNCRFPDEKPTGTRLLYSISSCFTELRIANELELCGSTLPSSPVEYEEFYGNYDNITCIKDYDVKGITIEMQQQSDKKCIQSCIEMEINSVSAKRTKYEDSSKFEPCSVVIEIANQPHIRYIRSVAKTNLDLVVAVAGVIGLFFGASILSGVEFIYIWLIRKF